MNTKTQTLLDLASFGLLQKDFLDPQVEHFDTFLRWVEIQMEIFQ